MDPVTDNVPRAARWTAAIFVAGSTIAPPAYSQTTEGSPPANRTTASITATSTATATAVQGTSPDSLDDVLAGLDHTGSAARPPKVTPLPPSNGRPGEKRVRPDYEGRPPDTASAGDVLLWIPRIALYPVHLTLNWLVRKPIVWAITRAEANYLFTRVENALTFFNGKATLFPTFLADFGLNPAVGLAYTHNDLFADGNTFALSVAVWNPEEWLRVAVRNEQLALNDDSGLFVLEGEFLRRPDQVYYGLGADTRTDDERIYAIERAEVGFELFATLHELNKISFRTRFRSVTFDNENARAPALGRTLNLNGEPLERPGAIAFGTPETIPGFDDRYQLLEHRIHLMLDSRSPDTQYEGGTGLRFEAFGSFEWDPTQTSLHFFRVGANTRDVSVAGKIVEGGHFAAHPEKVKRGLGGVPLEGAEGFEAQAGAAF
ncbi:MAG: hypothetical protein AAFV29_09310, partial [Myxococcota bacterium]